MDYFIGLKEELEKYLAPEQTAQVYQAYLLAKDAHTGQLRRSGEPYISHPVAVSIILAKIHMDAETIMAALLHDVLEDTVVEKNLLKEQFGQAVADLVDGVSKLTQMQFETRAEAEAENFRKMILAMTRDIRVIIIKLADRLHNMRTLDPLPPAKRRRIALETLEIYAPIAARLGMHNFATEFEDLGFAVSHPLRYRVLKKAIEGARHNREKILSTIENKLKEALDRSNIQYQNIWGREKHVYSIYKKMCEKHLSFSEVMDVYAFRVIVPEVDTCYRVLGAVHNVYKPVPERFKDYIAIPKSNGYQSLHTTLFGPYGVPIEIQIRTDEMERMAENGIAAHWLYKSPEESVNDAKLRAREWLKNIVEMQQSTGSSLEFIENVKIDLFPDEVYVFTPKGQIMALPAGACAVDFAYAVHSDVGKSCVAAKVDRHLAPLSMPLSSGQTVEIITAPGARPNPSWLNFVVTGKARSNIRHYVKEQHQGESIALGQQLLQNAFASLSLSFDQVPATKIKSVAQALNYDQVDALYEAIGLGNQLALVVAHKLIENDHELKKGAFAELPAITIKGTEGMVVHFPGCCRPIPGDPIIGVLNQGRGLSVHRDICPKLARLRKHPQNLLNASWEDIVQGEFKVDLHVEVMNQRGVLARLTTAIATAEANIDNISVAERDGNYHVVSFTLSVKNRRHLAQVIKGLRTVREVMKVSREKL